MHEKVQALVIGKEDLLNPILNHARFSKEIHLDRIVENKNGMLYLLSWTLFKPNKGDNGLKQKKRFIKMNYK